MSKPNKKIVLSDVQAFNALKKENPRKEYTSLEVNTIITKYFLSGRFVRKEFFDKGIFYGRLNSYKIRTEDVSYMEINEIINKARAKRNSYADEMKGIKTNHHNIVTDKIIEKAKKVDDKYLVNKLVELNNELSEEQLLKLAAILTSKGFLVYKRV